MSLRFISFPSRHDVFRDWQTLDEAWQKHCESTRERWIFRGHSDARYPIESTLERSIWSFSELQDKLPPKPKDCRHWDAYQKLVDKERQRSLAVGLTRHFKHSRRRHIKPPELEVGLMRRFQRQYHHFYSDVPQSKLEWLALMRHYGTPTRLVDWTWSFVVALFFAINDTQKACTIWALNLDAIDRALLPKTRSIIRNDPNLTKPETFSKLFGSNTTGVVSVSPLRLNQRLVAQQGTFVNPQNINRPFEDNLAATLERKRERALLKFTISGERWVRRDLLQRLQRINISNATLFPGLDGFARSLEQLFAFPDVIVRPTGRR